MTHRCCECGSDNCGGCSPKRSRWDLTLQLATDEELEKELSDRKEAKDKAKKERIQKAKEDAFRYAHSLSILLDHDFGCPIGEDIVKKSYCLKCELSGRLREPIRFKLMADKEQ